MACRGLSRSSAEPPNPVSRAAAGGFLRSPRSLSRELNKRILQHKRAFSPLFYGLAVSMYYL